MINIQLHNDCPATDTIVPNQFIDRFMPSANGEFVKVYLYLLRCIHSHASNCTISEIAEYYYLSFSHERTRNRDSLFLAS